MTKEEILEKYKECFTGNGEYFFEYVKPENALIAINEYSSDLTKQIEEQQKEILDFLTTLKRQTKCSYTDFLIDEKLKSLNK